MPQSINLNFDALTRMAETMGDDASLVVKSDGFHARGKVGTFFSLKSTNRMAGEVLFNGIRQKYGDTVADALAPRMNASRNEGRPLSARTVRDVLREAAEMSDGLSHINADMARHFVMGNSGPNDTRNLAHAFNDFCAAHGLNPDEHHALRDTFGRSVLEFAQAENRKLLSYAELGDMVRNAGSLAMRKAWGAVQAERMIHAADGGVQTAAASFADSRGLDAAQRRELERTVEMLVHHEAEVAADANRPLDEQKLLGDIASGNHPILKNFAYACGLDADVSALARDSMVWSSPDTAADMAVISTRYDHSGMGCVSLMAQRLGEMRALQPQGPLTRETVWQGCFGEALPSAERESDLEQFNRALFDRLSQVFSEAKPGDLTAPMTGMTSLASGVSLEKAVASLRGPVALNLADFVNRPALTPPSKLGSLQEVEESLAKDIRRRGTHSALEGYTPVVTFGVPGQAAATVNLRNTAGMTEQELADYNAGRPSSVSAELARRAVELCNGNDVQARQVILSMGQSGAFLVRSNSHFTGIFESEHSPLDVDVRREANGNVTMRFHKPAQSPLDMDYTYTVAPDGTGTLTACRIQARNPQPAAAQD